MHPPDGITTARLNGTAHRLLREKADDQTCAAELTAISSDPRVLGWAAGMALGAWRVEQTWGGDRVAALLLAAGGDPDVCEEVAAAQGCAGGSSAGPSMSCAARSSPADEVSSTIRP